MKANPVSSYDQPVAGMKPRNYKGQDGALEKQGGQHCIKENAKPNTAEVTEKKVICIKRFQIYSFKNTQQFVPLLDDGIIMFSDR